MNRKACLLQSCETCTLRPQSVVCDLDGEELATFQKIKYPFQYEPRHTVFYEGHPCLGLYLLCSGRVKLTRSSARGQRQIVRIVEPGQLIEKQAFRPGAVHEVTCETLESSQICLIEREAYLALVQRNPHMAIKLIHLLSSELSEHMDQLDRFTLKTARRRFAGVLLELGERFGRKSADGVSIGITLKREELAEMAGIAIETASRLLGTFRGEGLVNVNGRAITLLDPDRLARIAKL